MKNKRLQELNSEVSAICATCAYAVQLEIPNEYICPKKGVVNRSYSCRKYQENLLLKRPPKKRSIDTSRYNADDFSIE